MNKLAILIISFYGLISCNCGDRESRIHIEMSFTVDSARRAENFGEFIMQKLVYSPVTDSMVARISYPFTYVRMLNSNDWHSTVFNNRSELDSAKSAGELKNFLREKFKFDDSFKGWYASDSSVGQKVTVTYSRGSSVFYFRFLSRGGKWYINSMQELPNLDGHIPIEE